MPFKSQGCKTSTFFIPLKASFSSCRLVNLGYYVTLCCFHVSSHMCLVVRQFVDRDKVVCDSSDCKVMQFETSSRQSILQCKHSSDETLVMRCENICDATMKIVQSDI